MSEEADTLDYLWTKPLSPAEAELRGDLQLVHDALRELLMSFGESRTTGAREIRIARIDQDMLYAVLDSLTAIREKHRLYDRG